MERRNPLVEKLRENSSFISTDTVLPTRTKNFAQTSATLRISRMVSAYPEILVGNFRVSKPGLPGSPVGSSLYGNILSYLLVKTTLQYRKYDTRMDPISQNFVLYGGTGEKSGGGVEFSFRRPTFTSPKVLSSSLTFRLKLRKNRR